MGFCYVIEISWKGKVSKEDWEKEIKEKYNLSSNYSQQYKNSYIENSYRAYYPNINKYKINELGGLEKKISTH